MKYATGCIEPKALRAYGFLFSNTLNCVRAHPDVSGELNDSAIADFLLFGLNYNEATTTFRDVQRLPPAHCMTVSRGSLELRQYWTPPTNGNASGTAATQNTSSISRFCCNPP